MAIMGNGVSHLAAISSFSNVTVELDFPDIPGKYLRGMSHAMQDYDAVWSH
jgi:hypothetical protein